MPQGRVTFTSVTVSSVSERTAALQAAAAVVPVVNPRRRTEPDAVRTASPRRTSSRRAGERQAATHAAGYSKSVTGSRMTGTLGMDRNDLVDRRHRDRGPAPGADV